LIEARRSSFTALFALVVAYVLLRDLDLTPYDDAYFFKRFALNFREHGVWAWNAADGPVHGLTSQLFQWLALPLWALAPQHFVLASKLLSSACLLGCVWQLAPRFAGSAAGFALLLLAFANPLVTLTVHTGMETPLALLVLSVSLRRLLERAEQPRPGGALEAAALTTLTYLCRPDAALIVGLTFLVLHAERRRTLATFALASFALLGGCLLAFRRYYGTALPLPFYAKTLGQSPYDAALRRLGAPGKLMHALTWAGFAAPLGALGALGARERRPALALCVAGGAFVSYHLLLTNEIMGYHARFYVPALVPFALAAALGAPASGRVPDGVKLRWLGAWACALAAGYVCHVLASRDSDALERVLLPAYLAQVALAVCACFPEPLATALGRAQVPALGLLALLQSAACRPPRLGALYDDSQFLARSSAEVTTTRGLFELRRCVPLRTVYHSEIGVPGLVLPNVRVVDLAGLMSKTLALEHPHFDVYCLSERPEAIFLPHKTYAEQNREILGSECLREYTRVIRESSSPLYVRSDLLPAFERCARDVEPWR
jgi:hypothetical protein